MKYLILGVLLFSGIFPSFSQQFKYSAEITSVKQQGFYNVLLTPDVVNKSQKNLSDLRIKDSTGKEIPYVVNKEEENSIYQELPSPQVSQKNDLAKKESRITITLKDTVKIHRIKLHVKGPSYYLRNLFIYTNSRDQENQAKPVQEIMIMSGQSNNFILENIQASQLFLTIKNDNSAPLTVDSVEVFQRAEYLTTYLTPGMAYRLQFGNAKLKSPVYSETSFPATIPDSIPVVMTGSIREETSEAPEKKESSWLASINWIWIIGIGIVLLLGVLTYQMTREVK